MSPLKGFCGVHLLCVWVNAGMTSGGWAVGVIWAGFCPGLLGRARHQEVVALVVTGIIRCHGGLTWSMPKFVMCMVVGLVVCNGHMNVYLHSAFGAVSTSWVRMDVCLGLTGFGFWHCVQCGLSQRP